MRGRTRRPLALIATLTALLTGCGEPDCTDVGGEPLITLTVPEGGRILDFCIDGFECAKQLVETSTSIGVDDEERFLYEYTASVELDGERFEFSGTVEADPLFPNGERCGRSGKWAHLLVADGDTIEQRSS